MIRNAGPTATIIFNRVVNRNTSSRAELLWLTPLFVMFVGITLIAEILSYFNGTSAIAMVSSYGWKALRFMPMVLFIGITIQVILAVKSGIATAVDTLLMQWRKMLLDPYMLAARIAPIMLMPFFFSSFSVLKMLMPRYIPFWLDEPFARIDKALFFGHQPWELTHAIFATSSATRTFDIFYTIWVMLLSVAIVGFAFFAPRMDRARFFLSFGGAWVFLGFIGAWMGSSAGPCFAALLGIPSAPEFVGLMDNLARADVETKGAMSALAWQSMLWEGYTSEIYKFGRGISAMPSLHNAIAVLYIFIGFRFAKPLGWFMAAYAFVIFVGSIHLGWHYAVDGIVAALGMWAIWCVVDWWCKASGYDESVKQQA
jgi:PAP2 superfamily